MRSMLLQTRFHLQGEILAALKQFVTKLVFVCRCLLNLETYEDLQLAQVCLEET